MPDSDPIQLPADLGTWLADRAAALGDSFEGVLLEALYYAKSADDQRRLEDTTTSDDAPSEV